MSNRKTLAGAFYTSVPALFLNLIGVFVTPIIIRQLGTEAFGQWATSVSLNTLIFLLASFGLRPMFIRRVADASVDTALETSYQIGIRASLGLLAFGLSLLVCLLLRYPQTVLICTAVGAGSAFVVSINSALGDVLQGKQNLKLLAGINFIGGFVLTLLSLIVVLRGGGPVAVAVSYTSGPLLSCVFLVYALRKNYFPVRIAWNPQVFQERFREARLVGISQVFAASRDRLEYVLIPKVVGIPAHGLFSAATMLTDRLSIVSSSLGDAFFAPITRASKEGAEVVGQQVGNLLAAALVFCLPISLILAFLAPLLASILLPRNISDGTTLILVTVWSLPISALWQAMVVALQATQAQDEAAKANLRTTAVSVVVSFLLIVKWGILGAAVSQLTRPCIGLVMYWWVFNPRFPSVFQRVVTPKLLGCFLVMGGFLWGGSQYFSSSVELLTQSAPWVTRKLGTSVAEGAVQKVLWTTALMLLWALGSLIVFLVAVVALKVIPASLLQRLKRTQKRENV